MITVVGGGPAGSYAALLLAERGFEVQVIEEHARIGYPVQCAGIVTSDLKNFFDEESFIINKISRIRLFAPSRNYVEIKLEKPDLVIDRAKFDIFIAKKAKQAGVKYLMNHKFVDFIESNDEIILNIINKKNNKIKKIKTEILIGADGPLSYVAKTAGLFGKRQFFTGIQYRLRLKTKKRVVKTFMISKGFGWIIPESSDVVRVGIVSLRKDVNELFNAFMKKTIPDYEKRMISKQAGLVPLYNTNVKTQKNKVYLIGDAASQVKATTAGGILQALTAAKALASAIIENKNYEREWKRIMGRELLLGLAIRRILNKFSAKDYDKLIKIINNNKIKEILSKYNRERPIILATKLLMRKPSLLLFAKKLI